MADPSLSDTPSPKALADAMRRQADTLPPPPPTPNADLSLADLVRFGKVHGLFVGRNPVREIREYQAKDLIPKPELHYHGRGRGTEAFYAPDVVKRLHIFAFLRQRKKWSIPKLARRIFPLELRIGLAERKIERSWVFLSKARKHMAKIENEEIAVRLEELAITLDKFREQWREFGPS